MMSFIIERSETVVVIVEQSETVVVFAVIITVERSENSCRPQIDVIKIVDC